MLLTEITEKVTHFCRTGEIDPTLSVDQARLKIYHEHIRKKINHSLVRAFPLTHHLLQPKQWDDMVTEFFAKEECTSPFFWKVPQALLSFVKKHHYVDRFNIAYLEDLMDFEWLEIEMYMMPDDPKNESRTVVYSYPVFEKKPLPRPMQKGSYPLLAIRHPETKEIHFLTRKAH